MSLNCSTEMKTMRAKLPTAIVFLLAGIIFQYPMARSERSVRLETTVGSVTVQPTGNKEAGPGTTEKYEDNGPRTTVDYELVKAGTTTKYAEIGPGITNKYEEIDPAPTLNQTQPEILFNATQVYPSPTKPEALDDTIPEVWDDVTESLLGPSPHRSLGLPTSSSGPPSPFPTREYPGTTDHDALDSTNTTEALEVIEPSLGPSPPPSSSGPPPPPPPPLLPPAASRCVEAMRTLWRVVPPVLWGTGVAGNVASIVIMRRKKFRGTTTSLYLTVLALVDTLVLLTSLLQKYRQKNGLSDLTHTSDAGCRLFMFLVGWEFQFEAWILVSITLERFVAVYCPHKSKFLFTPPRAAVGIAVMGVLLAAVNLHHFWTYYLVVHEFEMSSQVFRNCQVVSDYFDFILWVWPWMEWLLASVVPSILLFVGNAAICGKLVVSARRKARNVAPMLATNKAQCAQQNKTGLVQLSIMLMVTCSSFLVTSFPVTLYASLLPGLQVRAGTDVGQQFLLVLVAQVLLLLKYSNFAINFLLYCVSSPRFREEIFVMAGVVSSQVRRTFTSRFGTTRSTSDGRSR